MNLSSRLDARFDEIVADVENKMSQNAMAAKYGVARSTIQNWIKTRIEGDYSPHSLDSSVSDEYVEIPVVLRDYSHLDHLFVYPMGDVHKGAAAHAADRWNEWLGYLTANPNASMLGTGDFLNAALKDSVSDVYDETMPVGVAKRELRKELEPLAKDGRIDILIPGNHEARIHRAIGDCPIEDVADSLKVPYARDAAVVIYKVGKIEYVFYVRHGTGGGQVGARANRLAQQARTLIADVYVSGHTHSQLCFPQDVFVVEKRKVVRRRQLFVSSGSFMNMEAYGVVAGFAPQKIGAPRIRLDGVRLDAHASI